MEWFQDLLTRFSEAFKWWFVLQPWEQALRVRAGRHIKKFEGGIHFKVPYLDVVFRQNCRLRITMIPQQTVTCLTGETVTIAGSLGYRVEDVTPLYTSLHMAEDTLAQKTLAVVADHVAEQPLERCNPHDVKAAVNEIIRRDFPSYGLAEVSFLLTDFAIVKTYRIIMGDMQRWTEQALQTDEADEV